MRVPESIRKELKAPLGKLVPNTEVKKLKGSRKLIIAVGDVIGKRLNDAKIKAGIWIYDGMVKRKPVKWELEFPTHVVANPKGNITPALMRAIDDCIRKGEGRIYVKGEEDLATLYCIAVAPSGATIVYGQPGKGVVIVEVGNENKKKAISQIFRCR